MPGLVTDLNEGYKVKSLSLSLSITHVFSSNHRQSLHPIRFPSPFRHKACTVVVLSIRGEHGGGGGYGIGAERRGGVACGSFT